MTTGRLEEELEFHALSRNDERGHLVLELSPELSSASSVTLKARETALRSVLRAQDPANSFLLALRNNDISVSGSGAAGLLTTTTLKAGLGLATGIEDPFLVSKGEEKSIRYRGGQATISRNALNIRVISFPDSSAVIAIDRYGFEIGYCSQSVLRLIELSPEGLSPSAGIYGPRTEPLFSGQPTGGCASCSKTMLDLQQAVQQESRKFSMLSNILKTTHDTAINSINNLR